MLDGTAGLWCCNAGHCRPKITEAIARQAGELDYAPAFQMGHPIAFELANRLIDIAPKGIEHVFYTNSGSESVETALKLASAYHRARGEGARTRLIGRERGYHGVNFGGISVGGIVTNRKVLAEAGESMGTRQRNWLRAKRRRLACDPRARSQHVDRKVLDNRANRHSDYLPSRWIAPCAGWRCAAEPVR